MGVPPLQTFQQPGPLDQAAKALQFKQMMGANQIQQQNIQEGDIALQQKQQDMKDQQTIRQLFIQNQGDMDKTLNDAISAGVKPQTIQQIKSGIIEQKTKLATLDKTTLEGIQKRTEIYGQTTGSILALPPEQRKQAAAQALPGLVQQGVVKPEEAQGLMQQLPQMDDQALEQFLKLHQYSAMATDKQVKEIRDNQSQAAKLPGEQADSDIKVRSNAAAQLGAATTKEQYAQLWGELPAKVARQFPQPEQWTPDVKDTILQAGMTPHEQASVPVDKIEMKDWLRKNPTKTPSDFLKFKAQNSPTMMMSNNLQLTPEATAMAAKLYEQTGQLPAGFGRAPQVTAAVVNQAAKQNPGADIAQNKIQFASQKALETEYFGRGKTFQNIRSLNTAIGHLGRLYDAAEALNNGDVAKLNEIGNYFNLNVKGQSPTAVFNAIKTAATGELGSTFKGSAATDPEIAQIAQTLNSNLAGNVNKDVVKEDLHLLGSRLYSIDQQYAQNSRSGPAPRGKILFGNSQNVLNRTGVKLAEYDNSPVQGGGNSRQTSGGGSGMAVSLSAARALPINKGKTDDQIKADIVAHGHQVTD